MLRHTRQVFVCGYDVFGTPHVVVARVWVADSHLDVVMADPSRWDRNPFELTIEGDKLYGRGTTDCLGHVALLTCFFARLAQLRPALDVTVNCVLIASEEAASKVRLQQPECSRWACRPRERQAPTHTRTDTLSARTRARVFVSDREGTGIYFRE